LLALIDTGNPSTILQKHFRGGPSNKNRNNEVTGLEWNPNAGLTDHIALSVSHKFIASLISVFPCIIFYANSSEIPFP